MKSDLRGPFAISCGNCGWLSEGCREGHAFLWFVTTDPKLSEISLDAISEPTNEILVSPASYWEVAIKVSLG